MNRELSEVLKKILCLPQEQRAFLADKLISSLEAETDVDVELAWQKEIQKRIDGVDNGRVSLMSWDDAKIKLQDN